jgi:hypothetical protein
LINYKRFEGFAAYAYKKGNMDYMDNCGQGGRLLFRIIHSPGFLTQNAKRQPEAQARDKLFAIPRLRFGLL